MTINVFLVDDHTVFRQGLRMILETQPDMRVIGEASSGREAVRVAPLERPDVLIIDVTMADLNGIEATRQIRARCPATQVVVLSMHSNQEYVAHALQASALCYVLKESTGGDVIAAVRAAQAGRRYLSQKIAEEQIGIEGVRASSPLQSLSEREREILKLIVEGRSSAQIGASLCLSPKTIETYRSRLVHKLGISDVPSLVKFAILNGLASLE